MNSVPGSIIFPILSRGSILPLARCASMLDAPPAPCAQAVHLCKSSMSLVLCSVLLAKVLSFLTLERITGADGSLTLAVPSAAYQVLASRRWAASSSAGMDAAALAGRSRFIGCSRASPSSSASCSPLASMTTRAWPSATCSSFPTRTSLTSPLTPAGTSLSIFMALITTTAKLPRTLSPGLTLISETCPWNGASTLTSCPAATAPAAAAGFPVTTSGLSLRKEVWISFPVKRLCCRMRPSSSLFTLMPCSSRPDRAPSTRSMHASKVCPASTEQITLMIIGSYSAGTMTPCATPLSIRMPGPCGSLYFVSRPAPPGSSETRAWMAQPLGAAGTSAEMASKPRPAATRS
mmetsp:Transcript_29025/g.83183  ORF Transcript_29025/g.83183 Transcript_29025/m.83183 type:complete len:349 (-) Transcript_29025:1131-2177(-)